MDIIRPFRSTAFGMGNLAGLMSSVGRVDEPGV
jgi:hypothetical protein